MWPDDSVLRALSEEDHQLLVGLVQKYGIPSLISALDGSSAGSSRASTFSTTTLLSSAPSLLSRSDNASIKTQSTWGEAATDMSAHEVDIEKPPEHTWLDSPALQSPTPGSDALIAPQLAQPTTKKYQCPTCYLDSNPVGFGRKSDFKKHLYNFHGADVTWLCRTKGCHLSFATERAYSTHAKEIHRLDSMPNNVARTELCPQLVFSCGFAACKDRIFEAADASESSNCRDKFFEHIAKHFEDGYSVRDWEYRVQIQNLMRQKDVKPVWKTCVWPKDKRAHLMWQPRSSGDLRRMLECRHLGDDISKLVRLAFILGSAPYTSYNTPPPSEIDIHFQLPFRSQCLDDAVGVTNSDGALSRTSMKNESTPTSMKNEPTPTFALTKHISYTPPSVFRLGRSKSRRGSRPTTPASMTGSDVGMSNDPSGGPHPGTPFPIPQDAPWPTDAPKFAPDAPQLPRQSTPMHNMVPSHHPMPAPTSVPMQTPVSSHMSTPMDSPVEAPLQPPMEQHHSMDMDPPVVYSMPLHDNMRDSWYTINPMGEDPMVSYTSHPADVASFYSFRGGNPSQASTVRPATPVPGAPGSKRPSSWGRHMSMDSVRTVRRPTPHGSPSLGPEQRLPPSVPNLYGEEVPNLYGQELPAAPPVMMTGYEMPMRTGYEHPTYDSHGNPYAPPMTFLLDESEGRM